jgi:hypothetical protein
MPVSIRASLVLDFSPAAALAAGATSTVTLTTVRGFDIYDFSALATATNAGSTAQLLTGGVAASNAAVMATDGTIGRFATGLTNARRTVAAAGTIGVLFTDGGGGGGANGHAYAAVLPNVIS